MRERELNVYSGEHIFKSPMEYFNDKMFLHGYPYYMINKVDKMYYLWELDRTNPDSNKYLLMKQSDDFNPLYDEAMVLDRKLRDEQRRPDPWEELSKELEKKIKKSE